MSTDEKKLGSTFTAQEHSLIKQMFGTVTSQGQVYEVDKADYARFIYTAEKFGLNPLAGQIWLSGFYNKTEQRVKVQVITTRDGLLEIAHRSGQLNGIQTGTRKDESGELIAWARVHRKDMEHPFEVEVEESEYNTRKSVWANKPKTMLRKVALAQCLKLAFSLQGLYEESEQYSMADDSLPSKPEKTPTVEEPKETASEADPTDTEEPKEMPVPVSGMTLKAIQKKETSDGKAYLRGLADDDLKFVVPNEEDIETLMSLAVEYGDIKGVKVAGTLVERQGHLVLEGVTKEDAA